MSVKGELDRIARAMEHVAQEVQEAQRAAHEPIAHAMEARELALREAFGYTELDRAKGERIAPAIEIPAPAEPQQRRKRDPAILCDRDTGEFLRVVTLRRAAEYAGVSIRMMSRHTTKTDTGKIEAEGGKGNRRVIVESLIKFYPPEK